MIIIILVLLLFKKIVRVVQQKAKGSPLAFLQHGFNVCNSSIFFKTKLFIIFTRRVI